VPTNFYAYRLRLIIELSPSPDSNVPMAIVAFARLGVRRHAQTRLLRRPQKRFHASENAPRRERSPEDTKDIPVANVIAPLPLWQRLGPLSTVFSGYSRSQRKRPLLTQFCSSLVIYFFADLSAQTIGGDEYNSERTARSLVIGGISSIPSYKWYDNTRDGGMNNSL
jgi:hypothetical protein